MTYEIRSQLTCFLYAFSPLLCLHFLFFSFFFVPLSICFLFSLGDGMIFKTRNCPSTSSADDEPPPAVVVVPVSASSHASPVTYYHSMDPTSPLSAQSYLSSLPPPLQAQPSTATNGLIEPATSLVNPVSEPVAAK